MKLFNKFLLNKYLILYGSQLLLLYVLLKLIGGFSVLIIKFLVTMAIILAMAGPVPIKGQSMTNSISDKEIATLLSILDRSIISYYVSHSGILPDSLGENEQIVMGLQNIDMAPFTYVKVDANTFRLTATLSNGSLTSANSNTELIAIESDTN